MAGLRLLWVALLSLVGGAYAQAAGGALPPGAAGATDGWAPTGPGPVGAAQVIDLGAGVPALRFVMPVAGGSVGLVLADPALLALVEPELAAATAELAREAGGDQALLAFVTATVSTPWAAELAVHQDAEEVALRHPFRIRLLTGDPVEVRPERPAVAVVLLPARFSLRRPLRVEWSGLVGEVLFRR